MRLFTGNPSGCGSRKFYAVASLLRGGVDTARAAGREFAGKGSNGGEKKSDPTLATDRVTFN